MLGGVWSFRPKSGWVSTSSLALVVAVARRQASTKAFGHSSFYVLLLSVLFILCVLALCALALGVVHSVCSRSMCSGFGRSCSVCSCFGHSSLFVLLL